MSEVFNGQSSLKLISDIGNEIIQLQAEIVELNISGKTGSKRREKDINTLKKRINDIKRYSKMLYVGFSRPTHLLAFAVEKRRFDDLTINKDAWEVINI